MGTPPRITAFMNQKGGVGKTTTTVNLAAAIARRGRRTLVVDLDPQAHATLHLGLNPEGDSQPQSQAQPQPQADAQEPRPLPTIYDVLAGEADAPEACRPIGNGLWILPAETALAGIETELAGTQSAQTRLAAAIRPLLGRFDAILLDCPPSLGLLTVNGLCAADDVVIPMQAHFLALQGMSKLLQTVAALRGSDDAPGLNPALRVAGVVLCMHDKQATHTQEVVGELEAFFEAARADPTLPWHGARIFQPPVRRNIKLAECPSFGQTIFEYGPTAAGAEDYAALADDFLGLTPTTPNQTAAHRQTDMQTGMQTGIELKPDRLALADGAPLG